MLDVFVELVQEIEQALDGLVIKDLVNIIVQFQKIGPGKYIDRLGGPVTKFDKTQMKISPRFVEYSENGMLMIRGPYIVVKSLSDKVVVDLDYRTDPKIFNFCLLLNELEKAMIEQGETIQGLDQTLILDAATTAWQNGECNVPAPPVGTSFIPIIELVRDRPRKPFRLQLSWGVYKASSVYFHRRKRTNLHLLHDRTPRLHQHD